MKVFVDVFSEHWTNKNRGYFMSWVISILKFGLNSVEFQNVANSLRDLIAFFQIKPPISVISENKLNLNRLVLMTVSFRCNVPAF